MLFIKKNIFKKKNKRNFFNETYLGISCVIETHDVYKGKR